MGSKKRGGGPKTAAGKTRSSQNATKHGVRSQQIRLLPDETAEQYEAAVDRWRRHFKPSDYQEERLVEVLIVNDWLLRRAQRWLMEVEASVAALAGPDPLQWTSEQRQKIELAQRYKGTAERAFYKSLSVLRDLRREVRREAAEAKKNGSDEWDEPPKMLIVVEDAGTGETGAAANKEEPKQRRDNSEIISRSEYERRLRDREISDG